MYVHTVTIVVTWANGQQQDIVVLVATEILLDVRHHALSHAICCMKCRALFRSSNAVSGQDTEREMATRISARAFIKQ